MIIINNNNINNNDNNNNNSNNDEDDDENNNNDDDDDNIYNNNNNGNALCFMLCTMYILFLLPWTACYTYEIKPTLTSNNIILIKFSNL